ncbi:MAG: hypothetical protein KDH88_20455 [Chromatiales bacterium]|nr:hypothetical protein [Chromatiales bacterium]
MRRFSLPALIALALIFAGEAGAQDDQVPGFAKDVSPILETHCGDCHSGWFPSAGLRVGSLEELRKGGRSGPAVIPGKTDRGWLMYSLQQTEGRYRMPPEGPRLNAEQIETIRSWIAAGARP